MTLDFSGKVAIVTGGGSGIGEACARSFAQSGASVVIADYDEAAGERVAQALGGEGKASFVKTDVSDPAQNERMVEPAQERFGGLDIAVNNAGIGGPSQPTGAYPIEGWQQVIGINLSGVFYGMRYEIPAMLQRGGGAIVNVASILGSVGFANSSAYVAAKHGVVGLTASAALEYAAQGVRVNAVGPGFINTPLIEKGLDPEATRFITGLHPIGRLGTAQEVAHLVVFLASDAASFVTGSYHLVDGGYTAQ